MPRSGLVACTFALAAAFSDVQAAAVRQELWGLDAVKFFYQRGEYGHAKQDACVVAWDDIWQPEALYYAASCLEKLNDPEQAAAFYHLVLRVLDENPKAKADGRSATRKATCEKALRNLDTKFVAAQKEYAETAAGKRFASPQEVSDLWMTQVKVTLHPLHGLYAWKLVGGRKDLKPDWIHNAQGVIHRSGGKLMDDIQGRRGVLFCIPNKKSKLVSQLFWEGPAKGKVLRIGTMAYNFPYLLNVLVGGKQIFTKTIGKDAWEDLRIPLDVEIGKDSPLVLDLVIPEDQRWAEGLFFDYIDFFEN